MDMGLKIETLAVITALLAGCSYPENVDPGGGTGQPSGTNVSIAHLKSLYNGHPYFIASDYVIEGCVTSTDSFGGFYKTLVIEDATGAIPIKIDMERLGSQYKRGTIVSLRCNGLSLGRQGDAVQIGATVIASEYEVGFIAEDNISAFLKVTGTRDEEYLPRRVTIEELSPEMLSLYVELCDVQFIGGEVPLTWCDTEPASPGASVETVDTDRTLLDHHGRTLTVRSSGRAHYALYPLPSGSGTIRGILSSFGGDYSLEIIHPGDCYLMMRGERF